MPGYGSRCAKSHLFDHGTLYLRLRLGTENTRDAMVSDCNDGSEAMAAEAAGADAIVAQGMEAGGHRGTFLADQAERQMVGMIALLPQVVDAVTVPDRMQLWAGQAAGLARAEPAGAI